MEGSYYGQCWMLHIGTNAVCLQEYHGRQDITLTHLFQNIQQRCKYKLASKNLLLHDSAGPIIAVKQQQVLCPIRSVRFLPACVCIQLQQPYGDIGKE